MPEFDAGKVAEIHQHLHSHLPSESMLRVKALETLLVDKGLVNSQTIDAWIEAYTDALAAEMAPLGVSVSVVEPGNYKSNIRRTSVARELEQTEAAGDEVTDEMKVAYEATAARELSYKDPDEVSEAFMHALFDDNPLHRYMVVPNAEEQGWTIQAKLNELVQLNEWGPYSYSRDELVELLDDALAGDTATE